MNSTEFQESSLGKSNCDSPMIACSISKLPEGDD